MKANIQVDVGELESQIAQIVDLLCTPAFSLDGVSKQLSDELVSRVESFTRSLLVIDGGTTVRADKVVNVIFKARIGDEFDKIIAALRAGHTNFD